MSKNKNVIKPGESRPFYFTFKSRSTGIFEEEWILECEPSLLSPLPVIKLCGHALEDDNNIEWYYLEFIINLIGEAKLIRF
jgi:hypothetical protein